MKIELTDEMVFAIGIAFDELSNSGQWAEYINEKQYDIVDTGRSQLKSYIQPRYSEMLDETK